MRSIMRKFVSRRPLAVAVAFLFFVAVSGTEAAVSISSAPTSVNNGETAQIVARVTTDYEINSVWLRYRISNDPKGYTTANVINYLAMTNSVDKDYVCELPILPGGTVQLGAMAVLSGGAITNFNLTWKTVTIGNNLTYDRFHDMKGIPGILSSATANDTVADWGWQQDKKIGGNSSTNFFADTPNGSQWKASGVVWARAAGSRNTNRLPQGLGLTTLNIPDTMAFPVMWIGNVPKEYEPQIRSPKLENGLGTISFNARNYEGESKIKIQVAYTDDEPGMLDWNDVQEYVFSGSQTNYYITNIVSDVDVKFVRIFRSEMYTGNLLFNRGWIGIDNICLTPPTPDIVMNEKLRNPGYMNATNDTIIRCVVSNMNERIPAINRTVTAYYCLTNSQFAAIAPSAFHATNMTYVCETNGWSLYEGRIPAQKEAGWLHYYYRCDFQGYYYVSPDANGMSTPKFFSADGSTIDAPTSSAATHLTGEIRASKSRYSGVQVMQIVDGVETKFYDMSLVDDNQWQLALPVTEGTVTESYFVGDGCYVENADDFQMSPYYYGHFSDNPQDQPYDTPTGGTPNRQFATTNNLTAIKIEIDSDGYMVYRFDDAVADNDLNYTIRRGVFQNFDDWEEEGLIYVESLYGSGVGTFETTFDNWEQAYGWLPAENAMENFQLAASNSAFSIKRDIVPRESDYLKGFTLTPENWYINDFRITNERVTNNTAKFAYGGSSNVVAQVLPGGGLRNADASLPEGVGEISAMLRPSITDGAKALYKKDWQYASNNPLFINTSFSIPPADRGNSHYYASLVFDYRDSKNYHELRLTRGDSTDANDNRLLLQLAEVYNGVETNVTHKTIYSNNNVKNETYYTIAASISASGSTLTVSFTTLGVGSNFGANPSSISGWVGANNAIKLNNCKFTGLDKGGRVGFSAYDCAPKFNYLLISGGGSSEAYSAGSSLARSSGKATTSFEDSEEKWFLGGTDDTADDEEATKWYFDDGYVLCRRIPAMTVDLLTGEDPFGLTIKETINLQGMQYYPYKKTIHSWDPFYVEFKVGGKGGANTVVIDSATVTPWRGGTRGPSTHANTESFEWTGKDEQNAFARGRFYRDNWLIFEGWAVTNNVKNQSVLKDVAARFQRSQANTNLVQALYSPFMTNGIGTVKFNYLVEGNSGDRVIYAIEYTDKDNSGDFGDSDLHLTAAVYTNTVTSGMVYGKRSCNVCTNYLYSTEGNLYEMRFRIRLLEGSSPDAVLWIDSAYANDYPEETDDMWKVYNGRLANAETSSEYSRIYGRKGTTLYLNNSTTADTGDARGVENPFDQWKPFLQVPYLEDGIGEIAFNYRVHTPTNASNRAASLTIAISTNKTLEESEWVVITNMTVTGTGYVKFDDPDIFQKEYKYVRFFSDTNNVGRICLDNILVMEPSRPGYDISKVVITPAQPIYNDPEAPVVSVAATISRLTQKPENIRLFVSWHEGTNVWGYSNWWTPELEGAYNTVELFESPDTPRLYTTQANQGLPTAPANGTIQYVVWGKHSKVPDNYTRQDVIFENDSAFVNPEWYGSVDLNKSMTNSNPSATFSPYYLVYSCAPGSIWINEVWNNYSTSASTKNYYPEGEPWNKCKAWEFIELCGKGGIDISGWRLNIYLKAAEDPTYEVDLVQSYHFASGTILDYDYNGWGFYVVGDEDTPNVDYVLTDTKGNPTVAGKIDALKASVIAIELLRDGGEDGILECACHIGGVSADPQNPNAAFSQRISAPKTKGSGASEYPYSYALLDDFTDEENTIYTNSVAGTASGPRLWYWALGNPTPGAVNRNKDYRVNQSFGETIIDYFTLDSGIVEGKTYGTQNGDTTDILIGMQGGASTSIVYVARSWYKIIALTSNNISVDEAVGKTSYTYNIDSISENVQLNVSFGPKGASDYASAQDVSQRWTDAILNWFRSNGWSEEDIAAGDGDKYSVWEEFWMDTDPTHFTTVDARTTSISLDGSTLYLGLGLSRTNWSNSASASGTASAATGGLNGVVNVYGKATLGGSETKVAAAQLAAGAFNKTEKATTSFNTDGLGLNFFIWRIEDK